METRQKQPNFPPLETTNTPFTLRDLIPTPQSWSREHTADLFLAGLCGWSSGCTHQREIHNLQDPDSQGQVDDHGSQQQEQEEVDASFPPAGDGQSGRVGGAGARRLQAPGAGGQDQLFLGNLQDKHRDTHSAGFGPQR